MECVAPKKEEPQLYNAMLHGFQAYAKRDPVMRERRAVSFSSQPDINQLAASLSNCSLALRCARK